jgi:CRP/FNR family cyclic AMP-dependent transcriptional regulator
LVHYPASRRFKRHHHRIRDDIPFGYILDNAIRNLGLGGMIVLESRLSGGFMRAIASPAKTKIRLKAKHAFNIQAILDSAGVARKVVEYRGSQKIYSQGDPTTGVKYIQQGGVKLSVVNEVGKEAVVAILGPGDFFGEGCLAGQTICMGTAATIAPTTILFIEKNEMMRVLHCERAFADRFMSYLLSRNIRIEEDLVDQLFNSSEKRLARTLLLLARYGKQSQPQKILPKVSQEMLAEMIGTTRSRVNFFMNKFRKLGFIEYNGGLHVHNSLLSVVLHD